MRTFLFLALLAGCAEPAIDERFEPASILTVSAYDWSIWNRELVRSLQQPFDGYCRFTVTGDGRVATFQRTVDPQTGTLHYHSAPSELDYFFDLDAAGRIVRERRVRGGAEVLHRTTERDASGRLMRVTTIDSFRETERIEFRDGAIVERTDGHARWRYHVEGGRLLDVAYFDDDRLIQLDEYSYDAAGDLRAIDEMRRTSHGSWTFADAIGGRTIAEHVRTDGLRETVTLAVDGAGRLLLHERVQRRDPDQMTVIASSFDEGGRLVRYVVDGLLGRTVRQFEYDCD